MDCIERIRLLIVCERIRRGGEGGLNSFWADLHHLSILAGSLNPLDHANKLSTIEQIHFVGANDKIVSKSIVESYISKMSLKDKINIRVIKDFNHSCCWEKVWPDLLNTIK